MANNYSFNPLLMAIKPLYEQAKKSDLLFAQEVAMKESRTEKPKSLAECADYLMGEAYKYASDHKLGNFGLAGCPEEQIVAMIKHYYDEDDIKINKVGTSAKAKVATTKDKPKDNTPAKPTAPTLPFTKPVEKTTTQFGETITKKITRNGQTFTMTELSLF